ncbi:hypothetical protein SKAU_G00047600 [Synaphobranchus kaupii]|uniref:Vezatin n=1 Tax=Synaphobranchus kaupii TaxID=118154 RepID=A0A9Q1G3P5_SYNKA|nr:hypothetical protein SKAU_G00047600 [Synaphobranchus kaupii]
MTEEFDEEVEFEYLQDLGRWDSEARQTGFWEEERAEGGGGEGPLTQDGLAPLRRVERVPVGIFTEETQLRYSALPLGPGPRTLSPLRAWQRGVWWRVADAVWRLFSVHQSSMSHREEQQLDTEFRQYSLRLLLEQDVFLQEDLELLELLDPGVLSAGSASRLPVAPPGNRLLPSARVLWTLAVLVALLAGLRSVWDGQGLTALLESLAQDSRELTALIRKALRLIQETEVISRGFTLLLDRVSAACPFNRAENQLLGLRKVSYRTLHNAFRAYRHATRHMLSAYPTATAT